MKLKYLGIFGIISLLSYTAMVVFSPLSYPGYDRLSMAVICFAAMMLGAIGTGVMPKAVFGLFERFSTFSAVIFNAVLGVYLLKDKFEKQEFTDKEKK